MKKDENPYRRKRGYEMKKYEKPFYRVKRFRGKRICNAPDKPIEFTGSLIRNILSNESYLEKEAITFFYVKNRHDEEFIMERFVDQDDKKDKTIVTLAYFNNFFRSFIPC